MISDLKPYAKYKASDSPWMGQVPSHWDVKPLRAMLKQRNEKNSPIKTTQILSLSIAHGVTLYSHEGRGGNKAKSDLSAYKIAHVGDIVLNSMNVIVGAVGLSKYDGAISPVYYALYPRSESVVINYFDKIFSNSIFQRYLLIYGKGILIKESDSGKLNTIRMKISQQDLKSTVLPLPSLEEQAAIVRFLNYANGRLERAIRAKRKVIALLNEQKQAIIHRAVTRGLDPNVKRKPSGISWLGDIPQHWELRRLKYLVQNVNDQTAEQMSDDVYIALEHVESWSGQITPPTGQVEFDSQVKRFIKGDILFGKLRPYLAKVARPKMKGVCVGEFLVLRVMDKELLPEFLEYKLRSKQIIDVINASTVGAKMPRADWLFVGGLGIAYPPTKAEQQKIFDFINKEISSFCEVISRNQREITLLQEYRTRLITDVVTGKIDVREVANKLPDETPIEAAESVEDLNEEVETADEEATA